MGDGGSDVDGWSGDGLGHRRSRWVWGWALLVILAGVWSRWVGAGWPGWVRKDLGDVLWGVMFVLLAMGVWVRRAGWVCGVVGFGVAAGTEFLKLYEAGWIDWVRGFWVGRFLLGGVFSWGNFLAYGAGAVVGVAMGRVAVRRESIR